MTEQAVDDKGEVVSFGERLGTTLVMLASVLAYVLLAAGAA